MKNKINARLTTIEKIAQGDDWDEVKEDFSSSLEKAEWKSFEDSEGVVCYWTADRIGDSSPTVYVDYENVEPLILHEKEAEDFLKTEIEAALTELTENLTLHDASHVYENDEGEARIDICHWKTQRVADSNTAFFAAQKIITKFDLVEIGDGDGDGYTVKTYALN